MYVCVRPIILRGVHRATRTQLTQREMYLFMPLSHIELHTQGESAAASVRARAHTDTHKRSRIYYTCWNEENKQREKQNISLNVALECILAACHGYLESARCSRGNQSFSAGLGKRARTHIRAYTQVPYQTSGWQYLIYVHTDTERESGEGAQQRRKAELTEWRGPSRKTSVEKSSQCTATEQFPWCTAGSLSLGLEAGNRKL